MVDEVFIEAVLDGVGVLIGLENDKVIDQGGIISILAGGSAMKNNISTEGGTQQLGDSLLKENLIYVEFGERLPQRNLKKIGEAPKP